MNMVKTRYLIILFIFYGCFLFGFQTQKKIPLLEVIPKLESQFDIKFSYSINDIEAVLVYTPNYSNTLQDIIHSLNTNTHLNFKFLNNRYITVSTINKTISICGILISEQTQEPLSGASVLISNSTKGVITDNNGSFTLNDVDINKIVLISFLGFETKRIKASSLMQKQNTNCKSIDLKEQNETLNQVLISKFLTTGLQKQFDGSTVLNTNKFGILPGLTDPDIMQSIQALPGIESSNESIANINVRGGTNDQNLILWDHIKMYHSGHFFGLISAYNPYLTNKVTISKNGTSSEFSDGVSSTINMFTKNTIENHFKGSIGINLINADAFFEIPLNKKLAIHISGRRSFTDLINSPTYKTYFERSFQDSELSSNSDNINDDNKFSEFFFYDYTAKLLFDLNKNHKFRANIIGINNQLDYNESFTNSENSTTSKTSNLNQKNIGVGGHWNAKWNPKFTTDFNMFFSKYNVNAIDYRINTDQKLTQANEVIETGIKIKTHFKVNNHLNFINGYQFNETGILNQTTVNNPFYEKTKKDVLLNHALFTELEYQKQNLYLRIGLRGNYFQKFNTLLFEPRLNFRQKISNLWAVKVQGEFKNQSANQEIDFQNDFLGIENRRWVLSNENTIPISVSKQVSLGFQFNQNQWLIDVEGFYKYVKGITASNQGFYNNFQHINSKGNYYSRGLEFLINKTARKYSYWLSYTYSFNDYSFKDFIPSVFPNNIDIRHSISLALNYHILENLKLSLGGIWKSGLPYTKPIEDHETIQNGNTVTVNYDSPNKERLPNFIRLDTSLKYNFNLSSLTYGSISIGVINLTNKKNSINRYFKVSNDDSNSTIQIDNKSLELTPNLSLRINF